MPKISKERYEFKKKLADMYTSQKKTVDKLWHMAYYEDWTLYKRYSEHPEMKKQTATALGVAVNEAQQEKYNTSVCAYRDISSVCPCAHKV